LLRICQEALTNVTKHSGAQSVQVKLKQVNGHLRVSISDDGRGFDILTYYHDGVKAKGHGLTVMRERAESIGGKFRVLSMPGQGTEVQVEVPHPSQGGKI
jgi:signal transduction histidine kinase